MNAFCVSSHLKFSFARGFSCVPLVSLPGIKSQEFQREHCRPCYPKEACIVWQWMVFATRKLTVPNRCGPRWPDIILFIFWIFIYLAVLGLSCGMWDPVPWPRIESVPPPLRVWILATGPPGKSHDQALTWTLPNNWEVREGNQSVQGHPASWDQKHTPVLALRQMT